MKDHDPERTLGAEPRIVPSAEFADRVMESVRREVEAPPIAFPWPRVLPGLVVVAAITLVGTVAVANTPLTGILADVAGRTPAQWAALLQAPVGRAVVALVALGIVSVLAMRQLAVPRRA